MNDSGNPTAARGPATDLAATGGQGLGATHPWRRNAVLAVAGVIAVVLRVAAARGDLVLDEIWSLGIASAADSAWQIVVIPHDNNHILNTFALYALGPRAEPLSLRLPAVAAGCLALWFAFALARRQAPGAELPVLILLGASHTLILFGTEARGYGYLACCTLAAWWALDEYLVLPRTRYAVAFAVFSSLGFLAHLTFVFAYAAFVIYSGMKLRSHRDGWQRWVALHILPVLTGVVLFFAYVLGMNIGSGYPTPLLATLLATLSLAAGGPQHGPAAVVAAAATALLLGASLAAEFRSDRARGMLFLVAIIAAPGLVLAFGHHEFIHPRYFLVPLIFGYVAVGTLLARWFRSGHLGMATATLLVTAFVVCNLVPVVRLIGHGRGQYSEAVRWMAEHTASAEVTVAGDHDFRNSLVAVYHAERDANSYSAGGKKLAYIGKEQYPAQGTEWFLRHSFEGDRPPPDSFTDPYGNTYELARIFPAGSLSGWTWWLYRRSPVTP